MAATKKTPEEKAEAEAREARRIGSEKRADEVLGAFNRAAQAYEQHGPFRNLKRPTETAQALTGKFANVEVDVTYRNGQGARLVLRPCDVADRAEAIAKGEARGVADCVNDPLEVLGFVRAYDLLADDIAGMKRDLKEADRRIDEILRGGR